MIHGPFPDLVWCSTRLNFTSLCFKIGSGYRRGMMGGFCHNHHLKSDLFFWSYEYQTDPTVFPVVAPVLKNYSREKLPLKSQTCCHFSALQPSQYDGVGGVFSQRAPRTCCKKSIPAIAIQNDLKFNVRAELITAGSWSGRCLQSRPHFQRVESDVDLVSSFVG